MNDLPENDRALIERLNRSLDQAAARPDPALDAALAATRARIRGDAAAARRPKPLRPWLWASGLALAAGLAAIVVLPQAPQTSVKMNKVDAQAQAIVASPSEDPEMLDNMDMFLAMDNSNHTRG